VLRFLALETLNTEPFSGKTTVRRGESMQAFQCKNHPDVTATGRCAGCAEAFCQNCLVQVAGQNYCASCKMMVVQGKPMYEQATRPSETANEALKYALIGIVCFGIVLEPMAIARALRAKREIAANPTLTGEGKANAALAIAIVGLVLWILGVIYRISSITSR
jgi:hypothetical protein